jgi:hypothetical protein
MEAIIAIGGTGARVLRSLIHIWALDYDNNRRELIPVLIDTDEGCGSARDVYNLTNAYNRVQNSVNVIDSSPCYFKHKIRAPRSLYLKDLIGVSLGRTFIDYVHKLGGDFFQERDGENNLYKDFMSLFYSDSEKGIKIDEGFFGNPKVGSLVFSNINFNSVNAQGSAGNSLYNDLVASDTINIVGSLHGGTGATGIMPVLKSLLADAATGSKKNINLFLIEPYYKIASNDSHTIQSKSFKPKAEASKRLYLNDDEIRRKVNSVYVISGNMEDGKPDYEYAEKKQNNEAHWIELVSARAIFHELLKTKAIEVKELKISRFHTHHFEDKGNADRRNIDFRNIKPESDMFWVKLAGFSMIMFYLNTEYLKRLEQNGQRQLRLSDFPEFVEYLVADGSFLNQPKDLSTYADLFRTYIMEVDKSGLQLFNQGVLDNRDWGSLFINQNEIKESALWVKKLNLGSRILQELRVFRSNEIRDRPLQSLLIACSRAMNTLFPTEGNGRIVFFRH